MPESLNILLSFSISFAVVFFAIPKIIAVSNAKKLFDIPNHRSANQEKVIPNLGGIALYAGIYVSTIISLEGFDITKIAFVSLATFVMFLMGLQDDTIGLSAQKKLLGQILVSIYLITLCDIRFTNLHGIFGIYEINYGLSLFISVISIIGLINAFNLIDGIDGLATGIGTIISSAYGFLFLYFGQTEYAIVSFSITGALTSFFFYNVFGRNNKIFMGDTGSLTLGVLFAVLTIWYNEMTPTIGINNLVWSSPAISLSIMIVPIVDTIRVFYIRLSQGRSPFSPDMNHIHHQLIIITKKNHLHASIIMVLANLILLCFSIGLIQLLGNNILFFLVLIIGFSAAYIPLLVNKYRHESESVSVPEANEILHLHLIKPVKNQVIPEIMESEKEEYATESQSNQKHSDLGKIQSN